jgi:hypothetical protein
MIYRTRGDHANHYTINVVANNISGRRGRDHMVFGFTTTYAISAYHQ